MSIKRTDIQRILNALLLIAAYGFLAYKIITYDDYPALWAQFAHATRLQWLCLTGCFLLFPVNRLCEAWKWRYLVREIEPMTMHEANRQVYYGTLGGFVTPYKIGEYPARALMFRHTQNNWLTATCLGLIGGYAMTCVIILFGLPACWYWLAASRSQIVMMVLPSVAVLVMILLLPSVMRRVEIRMKGNKQRAISEKTETLIHSLASLSVRDVWVLLGMSVIRYICFIVQLALSLLFCSVSLPWTAWLITQPVYFLLITITPNVPAAEMAVRGAWAAAIFERFGTEIAAQAVIASLILWAINIIFPLIVGGLVSRQKKKSDADL